MFTLMKTMTLAGLLATTITVAVAGDMKKAVSAPLVTLDSQHNFDMTVAKLQKTFKAKGLTIFAVIDHTSAAKNVDLVMQPTKVIIFGNPKGGTPLMQKAPKLALQLPLKVLVSEDEMGKTHVSFFKASFLAESVGEDAGLTAGLSKVEKLITKIVTTK